MVGVVTESAWGSWLIKILYANHLFLVSKRIEGLEKIVHKWKEAFQSKGLSIILGETGLMVCRWTKNGLWICKAYPCEI